MKDIVARKLVSRGDLPDRTPILFGDERAVGVGENRITRNEFINGLFDGRSDDRKQFIGRLVNTFIVEARIGAVAGFSHPLLCYRLQLPEEHESFLERLGPVVNYCRAYT